jgi:hypothetical protein
LSQIYSRHSHKSCVTVRIPGKFNPACIYLYYNVHDVAVTVAVTVAAAVAVTVTVAVSVTVAVTVAVSVTVTVIVT